MTKENAKEYLPLVQALAEGKTIQVIQQNECWIDLFSESEIEFSGHPSRYRIKPEPRRIYVEKQSDGRLGCFSVDPKFFTESIEFVEVVK